MSRPRPTAVDYVVIAISPALIMTLVGSLAFFLVRVFYQGQYSARLQYILALFVFAAVLISRISIESGKGRAVLFGLPLAIATGLALMRFGEIRGQLAGFSSLLNFLLLGIIWWATHKLTLDCTVLDESQVQTDQGLLQFMGLEGKRNDLAAAPDALRESENRPENKPAGTAGIRGWWKRLANPQRKRQTHGVWVVYFSLAALPLFGIGQLFVPASDASGRRYTFVLLCVYLLSGFGLLVTTSLISLRQYLRQRNLQMPNSMVKTWIGAGITLVLVVLTAVSVLPRSIGDFGVTQAPLFGSRDDLETSDYAVGNDGPRHDPEASRVNEQLDGGELTRSEGDEENGDDGESEKDGGQGKERGNGKGKASKGDATEQSSVDETDDASAATDDSNRNQDGGDQRSANADTKGTAEPQAAKRLMQSVVTGIWNLLKYAFYALLAAVAVWLAWKYRDELRTAWRELLAELRDLWNRLLGRRRQSDPPIDQASFVSDKPSQRPFSSFTDPFSSGAASRMSAEELVDYTFSALEAWAREHSTPRDPQQTPTEFTTALAERFESISGELRDLCGMYSRVAYAAQPIQKEFAMKLDVLWRKLASQPSAAQAISL